MIAKVQNVELKGRLNNPSLADTISLKILRSELLFHIEGANEKRSQTRPRPFKPLV